MKIELIIIPEIQYDLSFTVANEILLYRSIPIIDNKSVIHFDLNKIDFKNEKKSTIYLLFCLNLSNYPELKKYSDRMILMNAITPFIGKIISTYNFAGFMPMSNFFLDTTILYGKKSIVANIKDITKHTSLITSEIYSSIYKKEYTISEILNEYISHYLDFVKDMN